MLILLHLPRLTSGSAARFALGLAACSALIGMVLAVLYAVGRAVESPLIDIAGMARYHGIANGLGFVLTGLAGLGLVRPAARTSAPGVPFSRLSAGGRVGAGYFARMGALAPGRPEGLIDSVAALTGAAYIHPGVRAFFEATSRIQLDTTPTWAPGARLLGRLWNGLAASCSMPPRTTPTARLARVTWPAPSPCPAATSPLSTGLRPARMAASY